MKMNEGNMSGARSLGLLFSLSFPCNFAKLKWEKSGALGCRRFSRINAVFWAPRGGRSRTSHWILRQKVIVMRWDPHEHNCIAHAPVNSLLSVWDPLGRSF